MRILLSAMAPSFHFRAILSHFSKIWSCCFGSDTACDDTSPSPSHGSCSEALQNPLDSAPTVSKVLGNKSLLISDQHDPRNSSRAPDFRALAQTQHSFPALKACSSSLEALRNRLANSMNAQALEACSRSPEALRNRHPLDSAQTLGNSSASLACSSSPEALRIRLANPLDSAQALGVIAGELASGNSSEIQSNRESLEEIKYLGVGTSGNIFKFKNYALKFSRLDVVDARKEAETQKRIGKHLKEASWCIRLFHVPEVVGWYPSITDFNPAFPTDDGSQIPVTMPVLVMTLMEPLPSQFLDFCSNVLQKPVTDLALLALGEKSTSPPPRRKMHLRGGQMKLNYNECIKLGLPANELVAEIASVAAVINFEAGLDCADVEFRLAGNGADGFSFYVSDFDKVSAHHNDVAQIADGLPHPLPEGFEDVYLRRAESLGAGVLASNVLKQLPLNVWESASSAATW